MAEIDPREHITLEVTAGYYDPRQAAREERRRRSALTPAEENLLHPGRSTPDFSALVRAVLIEEGGFPEAEADRLCKAYPDVMVAGIMAWNVRATAMALQMKDEEAKSGKAT